MLYFTLVKKMYLVEKTINKLYTCGYTFFLNPRDLNEVISHLKKNSYQIFDPKRTGLTSMKEIVNNINGFIKGFSKGTKYKCPHLGCNLIYNEVDKTFDCPCHGSRFDKSGKVISAPANKDIAVNK